MSGRAPDRGPNSWPGWEPRHVVDDLTRRITGDTVLGMASVTIRDLRNHGGEVVDRVEAGEQLTVTRDGRPVAELRPVRSKGIPSATLVERWRQLPAVDADVLRRDSDALIDQSL